MDYKNLLIALEFKPKEEAVGVFLKKFPMADNYCLEVDFEKQAINYGNLISFDSKTTQNFSQPENFVVLECVNRLLEKGYKPENIVLEKTWAAGHGTSGRLDICVNRDDGTEYLLIECKTYGKEFDKEFIRMKKDGGQLFTYFKFSNKADIIMLYASELKDKGFIYRNEIVKIEDYYRTGDVKDFYEKWNKLTNDNGVFEDWVKPYNFESKALTINELEDIQPEDSSFIFNRFLEILRHNVVSDKPNAFNKIFTLFLCKIYDEKINEDTDNELDFQWIEGADDDISFQLRLTDLYKKGMSEFLEKRVTDFSEDEFDKKYQQLFLSNDNLSKELKQEINRIRLEKNNEFAIKEVYDRKSFTENAKVVKEIVELLQKYKIRYTTKQQYLSDFFELLLTTGLKQESGQFFTPVPIAQFIIKSLPIDSFVKAKLQDGKRDELLPYIIDYAAGSGHFVTESMHEIQRQLNAIDTKTLKAEARSFVDIWRRRHFDWALQYIYGIEKDYRLVKVGKVGCYLHGDGLANVIHCDGLASFDYEEYKNRLREKDKDFPKENKQFDILVSNPPYSVSAFKNVAREYYTEKDFDLYNHLTDNSSEIECLFVERTKQLLKDDGVAGVILPSSILSNEGIYTKAREIILQNFEIVAITELGSNTFMATGTNTVVLFLRRRNNYDSINLKKSVERFFEDFQDVTRNGIEKPVAKYVNHVWESIGIDDYITLLKKEPDNAVANHEIYKEYRKKIKAKTEKDFWNALIETEKEKLLYFILAYPQKVVLVKTGEKDAEKRFLGYEFSNRRGNEGIHPIQRGKTIDECTKLYDENSFDNEEKASTYIYKAFAGDYDFPIHESLKNNISRVRLVDMLTFDRDSFAKNISLASKKKVQIESRWNSIELGKIAQVIRGVTYSKGDQTSYKTDKIILTSDNITLDGNLEIKKQVYLSNNFEITKEKKLKANDIFMCFSSGSKEHLGKVAFIGNDTEYYAGGFMAIMRVFKENNPKFVYILLNTLLRQTIKDVGSGSNINNLSSVINNVKIPLPPIEIQQKIVSEIEVFEKKEAEAKRDVEKLNNDIDNILSAIHFDSVELGSIASFKNGLNYNRNSIGDTINIVGVGDFQNKIVPNLDKIEQIQIDGTLSEDYVLESNDLLVVRSNGSANLVGRLLLIDKVLPPMSFSGFTIRVRPHSEKVLAKYLCYYLRTKKIREKLIKNSGGSNIKSLNQTLLSSLSISLPSLSEQQKIVAEIEKTEAQIAEARKIIDDMPMQKNEILKKYL